MIQVLDIGYPHIYQLTDTIDLYEDYVVTPILDLDIEKLFASSVSGIIISHGSLLPNSSSYERVLDSIKEIIKSPIPILGIGLGHHLIGQSCGAQVATTQYYNDVVDISILDGESPLFNRLPEEISMVVDSALSTSIPSDFILLATSDNNINESMKHRNKAIYGVQFLPERSGNLGALIIENFVNISRRLSS